jgi:hypothetical protein
MASTSFNFSKTNDIGAAVTFAFGFLIAWLTQIVNGAAYADPHVLAIAALPALIAAGAVIGYTGTTITP